MTRGESPAIAPLPVEKFPALEAVPEITHAFLGRVAGLDVHVDRAQALERLDSFHRAAREELGLGQRHFLVGDQVHGRAVAVVDERTSAPVPGVDGLITARREVCLGVYVADCCAVYLVEPEKRVIGLLHSGRKGSELGITAVAIERMRTEFGCDPAKMIVQLSPCIRPPLFEVDFAALIVEQARAAGVTQVQDCGISTGANLDRYYSYRVERGKTGRMLALLALHS
ncbi:MAG: polyphenol oxidase family protein [Chthoniobacter sp.]